MRKARSSCCKTSASSCATSRASRTLRTGTTSGRNTRPPETRHGRTAPPEWRGPTIERPRMAKRFSAYPYVWRLPLLLWQGLFFVGPLLLMVAMSFWLVRNYRMTPDFVFDNWERMLGRGYFWDAYRVTFIRASIAASLASLIAFPASYALAFRVSETVRRWAIFFLIVPFFTSYLVRIYAWQVLLAESGPINSVIGFGGLGPFTMLNSGFGAMVGYMTLVLPLVIILQTFSLAAIDRNLIEAA